MKKSDLCRIDPANGEPRAQVTVVFVEHRDFLAVINVLLSDSSTLLDVGCGVGATLKEIRCPVKIGLDIHRPYLEKVERGDLLIRLNFSAERLKEIFPSNSIDSVTLIDVIEHFERGAAFNILRQVEEIAARKVIVFTPRGFFPQKAVDHYGLGGEHYQQHRSGWEVEDFQEMGYHVIIFSKFNDEENVAFLQAYGENAEPIDALLAWKDRSIGNRS